MAKLILLRHGQSEWNKRNLFTGWVDVPLSEKGVTEAMDAGRKMAGVHFGVIFTSTLVRAQMTAMLAMAVHETDEVPVFVGKREDKPASWYEMHAGKKECIPVVAAWELNERMYGDLQGLNKDETREKYGADQVKIWRRSFDTPPPNGESLKMTAERAIPYFKEQVVPYLEKDENVLIAAHGNSLRAIMMELDELSKEAVLELEIPTGAPICYDYADGSFNKCEL